MKHWSSLPRSLAELLEKCLEEDPKQRPAGFAEVLKGLDTGVVSYSASAGNFLHPRLMALTARLEEENPRRRYPSERLPPG